MLSVAQSKMLNQNQILNPQIQTKITLNILPLPLGGEIAPCPPSEVPLAGFLLIFQYIAVIIYFF